MTCIIKVIQSIFKKWMPLLKAMKQHLSNESSPKKVTKTTNLFNHY